VAVLAVGGVEHALLVEQRVPAHAVGDDAAARAQDLQLLGVTGRTRVAGCHLEYRRERLVDRDSDLAAEIAGRAGDEVAKAAERVAHAGSAKGEQPAEDALERLEAELEPRRDAEVPAGATKPPQKLLVLVAVRTDDASVGSDELRADEVVAGQAVLSRKVADPAAERKPADAGGADDAAGCHEAEPLRRRVEVEPGRPAFCSGNLRGAVHINTAHPREVDHEPAVEHAVPCRVVPASAHSDFEPMHTREIE
jgi:hypothetical protein